MGNFFTAWVDGVTKFLASSMNPGPEGLDRAITYMKNVMTHTDGALGYVKGTGVLTWSATIRIHFIRTDGQSILNTIAAGNITLADGEFCYVDLSETNNAALTMQKAAVSTGAASNFKAYNRLVMGYRNTASDECFIVHMPLSMANVGDLSAYVEKATYAAQTVLAATVDNTPAALTVTEGTVVGRLTGGNIKAVTAAELRTLLAPLDGRVQTITPADNVTIDWSLGETATLLLDRATTAITFSNPQRVMRLKLKSDGTAGRAATFADTIYWRDAGTTFPGVNGEASKWDWVTIVYDGTDYSADIAGPFSA